MPSRKPRDEARVLRLAHDRGSAGASLGTTDGPEFRRPIRAGVEFVDAIDPTHFEVVSGFGVGSLKFRFAMVVELFDIVDRASAKMRVSGKLPGSAIDVGSSLRIEDAGSSGSQLTWSATSEVSGTVAGLGARLMEGTARKLTQQFWTDFARRVSQERG